MICGRVNKKYTGRIEHEKPRINLKPILCGLRGFIINEPKRRPENKAVSKKGWYVSKQIIKEESENRAEAIPKVRRNRKLPPIESQADLNLPFKIF